MQGLSTLRNFLGVQKTHFWYFASFSSTLIPFSCRFQGQQYIFLSQRSMVLVELDDTRKFVLYNFQSPFFVQKYFFSTKKSTLFYLLRRCQNEQKHFEKTQMRSKIDRNVLVVSETFWMCRNLRNGVDLSNPQNPNGPLIVSRKHYIIVQLFFFSCISQLFDELQYTECSLDPENPKQNGSVYRGRTLQIILT
eukprot:TRINITY_DN8820_c0_g1_i1.p3 TRINITY_DN8820_c0_g1~~TRINITY_DN8820_c0_g1_i1.p3  ORF type:complete len:193 (+),score=1.38 TRINITY_DN8820_c0_g1_i1:64-642(+)